MSYIILLLCLCILIQHSVLDLCLCGMCVCVCSRLPGACGGCVLCAKPGRRAVSQLTDVTYQEHPALPTQRVEKENRVCTVCYYVCQYLFTEIWSEDAMPVSARIDNTDGWCMFTCKNISHVWILKLSQITDITNISSTLWGERKEQQKRALERTLFGYCCIFPALLWCANISISTYLENNPHCL